MPRPNDAPKRPGAADVAAGEADREGRKAPQQPVIVAARARDRRAHAVDQKGAHLGFRKGAAHTVAVDHRPAGERGEKQRQDGLDAADLDGDERGQAIAERARHRIERGAQRAQARRLLDADQRRTHDRRAQREPVGAPSPRGRSPARCGTRRAAAAPPVARSTGCRRRRRPARPEPRASAERSIGVISKLIASAAPCAPFPSSPPGRRRPGRARAARRRRGR